MLFIRLREWVVSVCSPFPGDNADGIDYFD